MSMKKINVLFTVLIAIAILVAGCNGNKKDAAIPTLTKGTKTGASMVGGKIEGSIEINSENELQKWELKQSVAGETGTAVTLDANVLTNGAFKTGLNKATVKYAYVVPKAAYGQKVILTFTITAAETKINTISDTIEIKKQELNLTYNSCDGAATNMIVTSPSVKMVGLTSADAANADLILVYNGAANILNTVASPDAAYVPALYTASSCGVTYSATGKKNTKIQKVTGTWPLSLAEIDALTITSSTIAGGGNGVNAIAQNDIIAFQRVNGTKGVIKVTSAPLGKSLKDISDSQASRSVSFEVIALPSSTK